jgi:hypothetical protein
LPPNALILEINITPYGMACSETTTNSRRLTNSGGPKDLDRKQGSLSEALPGSRYAASRCGSGAK